METDFLLPNDAPPTSASIFVDALGDFFSLSCGGGSNTPVSSVPVAVRDTFGLSFEITVPVGDRSGNFDPVAGLEAGFADAGRPSLLPRLKIVGDMSGPIITSNFASLSLNILDHTQKENTFAKIFSQSFVRK